MYALKGKMLKTQRGRLVKAEKVISESSVVALFYSASWSKYCKEFIPILKDIYAVYSYIDSSTDDIEKNDICPQENVKLDYNIAVINVPFDESKVAMEDHFRTQGDWYTIQYGDIAAVELQWHFHITFIPNIIVLDPEGNVVSKKGIQNIMDYEKNVLVAWTR